MGHIDLYAPVTHTWFLKSVPSRIGLLLDLPVKKLEQVVYFASYIVTDVYEEKRKEALRDLEDRFKVSKGEMQEEIQKEVNEIRLKKEGGEISEKEAKTREAMALKSLDELTDEFEKIRELLNALKVGEVIGELDYRIVSDRFPHVFKGGTGAEHLKTLLARIDLKDFIREQQIELRRASSVKKTKILQKIKLASNLQKSDQRPEWFILEALPIIPPDLRPMIQLDG
jgi:DNA-directed RNA polymerase subunit beta'